MEVDLKPEVPPAALWPEAGDYLKAQGPGTSEKINWLFSRDQNIKKKSS